MQSSMKFASLLAALLQAQLSWCSPIDVEIDKDGPVPGAVIDDEAAADSSSVSAGADYSFPMQWRSRPYGNQANVYHEFLKGCFEVYGEEHCTDSEDARLEFNRNQPHRMTNFTSAGYAKVKAPSSVMAILTKHWKESTDEAWNLEKEGWPAGNTYVNHWKSSTELQPIHGPYGLSHTDRNVIEGQVGKILSDWTGGLELLPTSTYGIRAYTEGSILAPHVDRLPLVISAIVNVAQEVREPWPLEVIDHSGTAVNITIEPGEMILYESHSVIHGRPYPLQGDYYANVFVHFEPVGYTKWLAGEIQRDFQDDAEQLFDEALLHSIEEENAQGPSDAPTSFKLPPYIRAGTEEASRWLQEFVYIRKEKPVNSASGSASTTLKVPRTKGAREAHVMAANGHLELLKKVLEDDPESLDAPDSNGWRPLHEAARSGNTKVVEYLLDSGAKINARTNQGRGGTALWWARHRLREGHEVIRILESRGGEAIPPKSVSDKQKSK